MVSKGRKSITFEDIQSKVSDATLVSYYLGVYNIPCFIHSPLRKDDRASFGLWSKDGIKIGFTDLATHERGGIFDLLSKMWQCSMDETLARIEEDLKEPERGIKISPLLSPSRPTIFNKNKNVKIEVKIRNWEQYDIDYWESYGIPLKWLKYAEIYPISHKIVTKNGIKHIFGADKLAYAFIEHKENNVTIKIYQPLNKNGYKWANTHDRSVISLWTKIPKEGDTLIICSSLKDALCVMANTNIPCIAPQGEGYGMSDTAITELKRRYKNIYVLYDNDEAGKIDASKLCQQTGFVNLVLPQFDGGKDVSDYYKCRGKESFIAMIKELLSFKKETDNKYSFSTKNETD